MQITAENATEYARKILAETYVDDVMIRDARPFTADGVDCVDVCFDVDGLGYSYVMTCWVEGGNVYGEW